MTEPIVTDVFPKQPRERIWVPIHFSELLESLGEEARALDPIELDPVPTGITIESQSFNVGTSVFRMLVAGGVTGRKYVLTVWINTVSGARHEHEVTIKVKEQTK
jgi:hypothetical protein